MAGLPFEAHLFRSLGQALFGRAACLPQRRPFGPSSASPLRDRKGHSPDVSSSFRTLGGQRPGLVPTWHSETKLLSRAVSSAASPIMDPTQEKLMLGDECILVDENDKVVGHDTKYNCHLMERIEKDGMLHRAFSVFLFDAKNRLLLQQRAASKVTFPLVWTNTCCSHPLHKPDEMEEKNFKGVKVAAQRKLEHELGIPTTQVPLDSLKCVSRIHYKAPSDGQWGEHELDYLIFMKGTFTVNPNPNEVAAVQFVTPEKLKMLASRAEKGDPESKLSPWFKLVIDNFLYEWWDHLKADSLDKAVDMATIHRL